jgi:ubiquinone/menaquinone biosynthesis C-methylase UbiE
MLTRGRASATAAGLANVAFERADAQVQPFGESCFDAVISRFGIMFFADPVAAFANLRRATRRSRRPARHLCGPTARSIPPSRRTTSARNGG